jgi:predicted transcriptional regulator
MAAIQISLQDVAFSAPKRDGCEPALSTEGKMDDSEPKFGKNLAELTTGIVSAYVSNNSVSTSDLPAIIHSIRASLSGLRAPSASDAAKPIPAIPIKRSVMPDYIVSLEDGRHFKSLKRYLTGKGMTPAEYRAKWGLPKDYPMVAPNYAAKRSQLAKALGLGQQRRKRAETVAAADPAPKAKGGRPRKPKAA